MIRHQISMVVHSAAPWMSTTCGLQLPSQSGIHAADIITMGEKRHDRDAGEACAICFGGTNGYYAPFRGSDTMGIAGKVTEHLINGQQWPDIKAMSNDEGALIGYNVQFGPDHGPVHVAIRRAPMGPGFTIEALLAIALHRIRALNEVLPSAWNEAAIEKMRRALEDLHDRTRDREARGVEGTAGA